MPFGGGAPRLGVLLAVRDADGSGVFLVSLVIVFDGVEDSLDSDAFEVESFEAVDLDSTSFLEMSLESVLD